MYTPSAKGEKLTVLDEQWFEPGKSTIKFAIIGCSVTVVVIAL
jgi:hypothetical protein